MDYLTETRQKCAIERYYRGYTVKELARTLNVSKWQIYRDSGALSEA